MMSQELSRGTFSVIYPPHAAILSPRTLSAALLRLRNAELDTTDIYVYSALFCQVRSAHETHECIVFELKHVSNPKLSGFMALGATPITSKKESIENARWWHRMKSIFFMKAKRVWTAALMPGQFYMATGDLGAFLQAHFDTEEIKVLNKFEFSSSTSFSLESLICLASVISAPRFLHTRIVQPSSGFIRGVWYAMGRFPHLPPQYSRESDSKALVHHNPHLKHDSSGYQTIPAIGSATVSKMMEKFGREVWKFREDFKHVRVSERSCRGALISNLKLYFFWV